MLIGALYGGHTHMVVLCFVRCRLVVGKIAPNFLVRFSERGSKKRKVKICSPAKNYTKELVFFYARRTFDFNLYGRW